ncbi:nucleoid-associated protein, partial [Saprospiraceae bacterium]|nr:nucleoid-associated protein [Saprospiraceae bacterium]
QYAKSIFQNPDKLYEQSRTIAAFLHDKSGHPNINSGDLFVAYLEDVLIDDEMLNAIAIFKSENKDQFLKMAWNDKTAELLQDVGISLSKIDKACLIFDSDPDGGYKVLSVDKTSRGQEALYWKEEFLGLKPKANEFFQTKQFIQLTKSFVKERLKPMNELDKSEEAAIMHRSKEFFEKTEEFDQEEYSDALFQNGNDKEEFKSYVEDYQEENQLELQESFSVSIPAVKNQNRVFKSVIKLDKNFHIYVHGDRRLIEKGAEVDGRKYYKVYFDSES